MRLAVEKSVWTRPAWAWEPQTPTTPPPLSSFRTKEDNDFSARSLFPILLPPFRIQHRIESDRNRHPIDPKPWESKRRDGFAAADWIRAQLEFRKRREREGEGGASINWDAGQNVIVSSILSSPGIYLSIAIFYDLFDLFDLFQKSHNIAFCRIYPSTPSNLFPRW